MKINIKLIIISIFVFCTYGISNSQTITLVDTNLTPSNCSVPFAGDCDGQGSVFVEISLSGYANPSIDYAIFGVTNKSNENVSSTTQTFTELCAGTYTLIVSATDLNAPFPGATTRFLVLQMDLSGTEVFITTPTTSNVQCSGEDNGKIDLNITGGTPPYNVVWNHGPTTENITGLSPNQYFVDITDQVGCNTKDTFAITDGDTLTANFNFSDACVNTPINFTDNSSTSNGTLNYEWSFTNGTPSTANTVGPHNISFNTGGNNDVKLKIDNGNCTDSITKTANIFPPPTITLTNDDNICSGESIQLLATGGTMYAWTGTGLSSNNIPNPVASPTVTTTYEVTVTNANGCSVVASVTITVDPLPIINTSNDTSVCVNENISLTASGGNSYLWTPTTGVIGSNTSSTINATITNNITYKVVVSTANNCKDSTNITVIAKSLPSVNSTADLAICENQPIQLTVTGADTYLWTPTTNIDNTTSSTPTVTPSVTTKYFVTGTSANGCVNTDSTLVTVNQNPTITVSNDTSICEQQSVTLQASGGISYLWKPINKTTASITEAPLNTTIYEAVTTDNNGCKDSAQVTVTVNPLPTITTSNDTTICQNDTVFLSVSGANTYLWSPTVSNNTATNPFSTPTTTTLYKVVGTDGNGCKDSSEVTVLVNTLPSVTLPKDSTICFSGSLDITATGALTYNWSPSTGLTSIMGATVTASPNNTITYEVSGQDANQCSDTATITITVQPEISVNAMADLAVCKGNTIPLTATVTNATTTIWSPTTGVADINATNTTVTPTTTTTYTITASNATGCTNTDNVTITVDESPNVTITKDTSICEGSPVTLTATGGNTYIWNPTGSTSDNITVNPTTTTQYKVTIGTPAGCDVDTSVTITVFPLPTASAINDTNICLNSELNYSVNSGINTVSWISKNNGILSTNDNLIYTPTASDSLFVTFKNANNCTETDTIAINVFNLPTVSVTPTDTTICLGDTATFSASGANNYNWITNTGDILSDNNSTTQIVTTTTKAYQVIGTDANGCKDSTDLNVTVSPIPNIIASNDTTICFNDTITLNASGADNYTWSPNTTLDAPTSASTKAFPTTTTQYIVTGEFTSGCSNTDTVNVTVQPEITVNAMADLAVCKGNTIPLTATVTNATTTIWSPTTGVADINVTNTTVTPTTTTTYTITASNATGCTNTDNVTITVDESPNVTITKDTSICEGSPVTLTATGGNTYMWNPTGSTSDNITVSPNTTTQYNVTIGTPAGCDVDTSVTITTIPLPTKPSIADTTICEANTLNMSFSTTDNIRWSKTDGTTLSTTSTLNYTPVASEDIIVTLINGNNCTISDTFTVNIQSKPLVNISSNNGKTICNGEELTLTATGAISYEWKSIPGIISTDLTQDTIVIRPTVTTTYQVTGTVSNCTANNSIEIDVKEVPTITVSSDTNICQNSTITLIASGASSYVWSPNVDGMTNPNNSFTNVTPTENRIFTVIGTAGNGCTNSNQVSVTTSEVPSGTVSGQKDTLCFDEQITLTATLDPQHVGNVNGAYSFNNNTFSTNNKFDLIGNPSGEKQLEVIFKNQFGCTSTPINIKTFVLKQITYKVDTIHFPSCQDPAPSGEFTLKNIVGGNGNYSINFNNFVTTDTNFVFKNISPGSYPLNVIDNKGCSNPSILDFNSSLNFDTTITSPTCNSFTDGSINLSNITGGVSPYQFSLNGKNNYQADSNFANLTANNYTIFVKDASDCEVPLLFELSEPLALKHTILNFTPEKCVGDNNGKVSFVIKGGTVDYSTNINNTTITGDTISLINLLPNTYKFTITDSKQCTYIDSIIVTPADSILTYASQKLKLKDCKSGDASGVIDSTIGGSGFYQYSIDNGVTFKDKTNIEQNGLDKLNAGTYIIITKDIVSTCTAQSTLTIGSSIDLDTLDHKVSPPSCKSLVDGRIELLNFNALGLGNLRFELVESPSLNPVFSKRFSHTFQGDENSNLTSGNYIVIIHDENDCKYNHDVTVPEVNVVTVKDSITPTSCGENNGSIQFDINGGELPYTITFTYPNKTDSISTNVLFDTLGAGTYRYSITDNASCITTDSIELFNDRVDIVTKVDSLRCYGDKSGAVRIIKLNNADTSKFNYSFVFDNQTETTDSNFTNLNGGWYTLQVNQRDKTTSDLLCTYNDFNKYYNIQYQDSLYDTLSIDKINIPSPDSIFSYTQTIPSDADEDNGEILIDSTYGKEAPHYISLNDTNSFKLHTPGTQSKFQPLGKGKYLLFTKDNKGCLDTLVLNVGVSFFMPNVFTPNFDGKNDYLEIFDFDSSIYLKVYDQWGTIIYEMKEYDNSWDGGTAPDGTYFYEVITDDKKLTGWIQIIR